MIGLFGHVALDDTGDPVEVLEILTAISSEPLPFKPLGKDSGGTWRWYCPKLAPDGTCTIYEGRPHACRAYEIGQDQNCFYWEDPADGGA